MTDYFAHESSFVDEGAEVGAGTNIWHFSHLMAGARIGDNCNIGQNVFIGSEVVIGDHVKIQNNVSLYKGVTVEDYAFLGPSMVFTNVVNPRSHISRSNEFQQTLVKRGASIGANATLVCGVMVGRYSFVGAGAVITKDIPDYALVYGNPGKLQGWVCQCGTKLNFWPQEDPRVAECGNCGTRYSKEGLQVSPSETDDENTPA